MYDPEALEIDMVEALHCFDHPMINGRPGTPGQDIESPVALFVSRFSAHGGMPEYIPAMQGKLMMAAREGRASFEKTARYYVDLSKRLHPQAS